MPVGQFSCARHSHVYLQKLIHLCGVIFLLAAASACGTSSTSVPVQPTLPPLPPTVTPTLPSLAVTPGWHVVLDLSNTSGASKTLGGEFVASNPYQVIVTCEGAGSLTVTYAPQGQFPVTCHSSSLPTSSQVGTADHPPVRESVHVTITSIGSVVWHVLIEVQN